MRRLLVIALIIGLAWSAWHVWVPPYPPPVPAAVDVYIEPPQPTASTLWRITTHRMVWKQGVTDLRRQLAAAGFHPQLLQRKEDVELYAFDDKRTFKSIAQAQQAQAEWNRRGVNDVDIEVLKPGRYHISLGRYYIMEFAQQNEKKLSHTGLPYQQTRRVIRIPAMRFVFPAMLRPEADTLWKKLQNLGVSQPLIMQDDEFQRRFK
ncbi:MAG: hypothetical protein Q9M09_00730 [Mariprofundaceae bacterium]|nr:hypothetical protein [Mariprofundaceae bacterium]